MAAVSTRRSHQASGGGTRPSLGGGRHNALAGAFRAWAKTGIIKRRGKTITLVSRAPRKHTSANPSPHFTTVADVAAYVAAIALACVAAVFSIRGMVVLFPGAPLTIVTMAIAMESAKLVTAAWLAARWNTTAWICRTALATMVTGLATINAVGAFSQLVAAHVGERVATQATVETQDAALAARIELADGKVTDLDRRLGQIDQAVEGAAKRGRTNTALWPWRGSEKSELPSPASGQRRPAPRQT